MAEAQRHIGTFEAIALGIAELFLPLKDDIEEGRALALIGQLGLPLPDSANSVNSFQNAIGSIITPASLMPEVIQKLINAIDAENDEQIIKEATKLTELVIDIIKGIKDTADAVKDLGPATGIPPGELNDFADKFPQRLIDYLIVRNLEKSPFIPEALEFFGVIERTVKTTDSPDLAFTEFTEYKFSPNKALSFIQSPLDELKMLYGWGENSFDGTEMLTQLQSLIGKAGFPSILDDSVSPVVLDLIVAEITVTPDQPKGLLLTFQQTIDVEQSIPFSQGDDWQLEANLQSEISPNSSLIIRPDGNVTFDPPDPAADQEYSIKFTAGKSDSSPFIIFGEANASRLEVKQFIAELGANLNFENGKATAGLNVGGKILGGKVFIDTSEGDGFINQILSFIQVESDFDVGFGVSSKEGVFFNGSASLIIQLPVHIDLGPAEINALSIGVGLEDDTIPIELALNIKADLGPLQAVVEEMGIIADLSLPPDREGNLGLVDFDLGFKPPNGVGLSVDAGIVKGGGYLFFDIDREEYAGALELVFSEWIALKAIGLITTRLPDGSKGFSLLIIITVEFGTGIQLGFGFTLLGVGGILGLNRIVNIEPLALGVRDNSIESVMFPEDVIANAPRIISDLRKFFPPANDIFLVGPMAKIGWGTPTLVSVTLGVVLEFPEVNITILGVMKVALPTEEADILRLQVNFIGRIEPSNKLLWFYAELYDSRVLTITLEGGFGLLVAWGDNANFVVSVGGFHPRYNPPPLPFPEPPRISVSLLNTSIARIRVEGYFAVTSNTAQFGARAELFFGFSAFKVEGHLSFDALFQFQPFYFIFEFSVGMSVKVFGFGLFTFSVSGLFEGPSPWHIKGHAKKKITFLGPTIKVPIDKTWGENKQVELPPIEVLPLLQKEFDAITNWEAVIPENSNILVTLRQLGENQPPTAEQAQQAEESRNLVLHPVGTLRINQRKIPLKITLDKVGNQRPVDANRFSVSANITGGNSLQTVDTKEQFAPAEFRDLDESNKLSSPGFEKYDSGVEVKPEGEQLKTSMAVKRVIRYEQIIIDNNFKRFIIRFFKVVEGLLAGLYGTLFTHFLAGSAVTKTTLSNHYQQQIKPFDNKINIKPENYSVASTATNVPVNAEAAKFTSQAAAIDYLRAQQNDDPAAAETMHVIPNTEINIAA